VDDPELPDEYLREIGRIVVAWNRLDSALTHALVFALIEDVSTYKRAVAVFAHMSFPQKLDSLAAMLRIIGAEFADLYLNDVQGLLKQAQEKRNTALHQYWYVEEGEVIRGDIKARGSLKVTSQKVTLQDLRDIVRFIDDAYASLFGLVTLPLSIKFTPQQGQ
jgi:sulfur transfer complex TusBCD TusB component (DsrH family)